MGVIQVSSLLLLFLLLADNLLSGTCLFLDLHSLWDDFLIAKAISVLPSNYSLPLPYPKIEGALQGASYDPYIRHILREGTLDKWANELDGWLSCPTPASEFSVVEAESTWQKVLSGLSKFNSLHKKQGVEINPDEDVVCPYFWSQPLSALNCDIVWPKQLTLKEYESNLEIAELELDTPEYAGVIKQSMLLEKLLAQGGIRLAGLLNYLFADESIATKGPFVMNLRV